MKHSITFLVLLTTQILQAQDTRAFNQNASRSNHTRLSFSIAPVLSSPLGSQGSDTLLFRSRGVGVMLGADYFFKHIGVSAAGGFTSGAVNNTRLSRFINKAGVHPDQVTISGSRSQSSFLLIGPSVRTGGRMLLETGLRAGLFFNNPGVIRVTEKGSGNPLYGSEPSGSNVSAGWNGNLRLLYQVASDWSVGLQANYLQTGADISSFDSRRGNQVNPVAVDRTIRDLQVGLAFTYHIRRCNEPTPQTRAQNNNTVRSNRTDNAFRTNNDTTGSPARRYKVVLVEADMDGDGIYETDITKKARTKISVDGNGEAGHQQKAGVSTSRSNIIRTHLTGVLSDPGEEIVISYSTFEIKAKGEKPVRIVAKSY